MAGLRAIETRYNGYRFRSRLEARWAVFFGAMGAKWEYEPEGFVLSDGRAYLPDFWLPEQRAWFEVKPAGAEPDERHLLFAATLHSIRPPREGGYTTLYVVCGAPYMERDDPAFAFWHSFGGYWMRKPTSFTACEHCGYLYWWYVPVLEETSMCPRCRLEGQFLITPGVREAYERARSARFGFGEQG